MARKTLQDPQVPRPLGPPLPPSLPVPLAHSAPVTVASWLFLPHTKTPPTAGPLHLLIPPPGRNGWLPPLLQASAERPPPERSPLLSLCSMQHPPCSHYGCFIFLHSCYHPAYPPFLCVSDCLLHSIRSPARAGSSSWVVPCHVPSLAQGLTPRRGSINICRVNP